MRYIFSRITINSYDLMDSADIVVTFGSTIGIEANFYEAVYSDDGHAMYEDTGHVIGPGLMKSSSR